MSKLIIPFRIFLVIILSFLGVTIFLLVELLKGKTSLLSYPLCENGVMDFEGYEISEEYYQIPFEGEIEFFYNQWLVTDGISIPENKVSFEMPNPWTGVVVNGKKLPKTGYASYRLLLTHMPEANIKPYLTCDGGYRLFMNGELVGQVGELSKTEISYDVSTKYLANYYKVPADGVIEIVIEVSYNDYGGLHELPAFVFYNIWYTGHYAIYRVATGLTLGLFLIILLITLTVNLSMKKEGRYFLFFFLLGFFLHFIFSFDMISLIKTLEVYCNIHLFERISFVMLSFTAWIFCFYLNRLRLISIPKWYTFFFSTLFVGNIILFMYLYGTRLLWISFLFYFLLLLPHIVLLIRKVKILTFNYVYLLFLALLLDMSLVDMLDTCSILTTRSWSASTLFSLTLIIVISVMYVKRFFSLNRIEVDKANLQLEALSLKQTNLLNQIKPHFVYNSLSAIQSLYHKNIEDGDLCLQYFARYLRTNIDAFQKDFIPFEQEIENIINYINLENFSLEQKFQLKLDLEYEDFLVPILSLEPLVENAIKYSQANLKSDGYILIASTRTEDGNVVITIKDNGLGFDIADIKESSKGIMNSKLRLEMGLNAKVTFNSKLGEGTEITIVFEEAKNEDFNH